MSRAEIGVADRGPVRILTIDRPHRRNALTICAANQLRAELDRAESDAVGAVMITGAEGHFSAGGDGDVILGVIDDEADDAPAQLMRAFHRLVETVWNSPLPVLAAVSGVAYGGAFNLALACDLIYCSADARFCQVFLRRGVVPDVGGAYLLPRLVGMQRAKELVLLTSELDAARAHELGLVNAVLPDSGAAYEHTLSIAEQLANGPRFALAQAKKLLNASTGGSFQGSLELEAAIQAGMLRAPTSRNGFHTFLTGHGRQHGLQ